MKEEALLMKNIWKWSLLWLTLTMVSQASAELVIQISQSRDDAVPIAIVPFGWQGEGIAAEDVAQIIAADLHRTGQFRALDRGSMRSFPENQQQVFYRDWRQVGGEGVAFVVIGRLRQDAATARYLVEYELLDVYEGRPVKAGTASGTRLRDIAHYISDDLYETLTGVKGAFSTRLAYVTAEALGQGKQKFRLLRADSDGFNERVLVESDEPILSPSWAPNGRDIAYVSFEADRKPGIYIINTSTGVATRITHFPGLNGAPSFSPDGQRLAMTLSRDGNPEIYVYEFATGKLVRLTQHYAIDTEPAWHPSGARIAFTSDRGGTPQIYEIELATSKIRRLTFEGSYNARPFYTPDGRSVALVHQTDKGFHIAVQDQERGLLRVLTHSVQDESPSVAPNGAMIIYATQVNGRGVLAAVSMDGRVKVNLPSSQGDVREPSWSSFLY
jgi:TolB protein